jgi:hypothetical protein
MAAEFTRRPIDSPVCPAGRKRKGVRHDRTRRVSRLLPGHCHACWVAGGSGERVRCLLLEAIGFGLFVIGVARNGPVCELF